MLELHPDLFFAGIRPLFGGSLKQSQVLGINALLAAGNTLPNLHSLAYVLATTYHETARTMQPIEEYGKGKAYDYGKKLKMSRQPYTVPDKLYYGRGFVQLTWFENYAGLGRVLGVDLLNNPELALRMDVAARIAITGMTRGLFTGKKLADYFHSAAIPAPIAARRIINGQDCAERIAGYYATFLTALQLRPVA